MWQKHLIKPSSSFQLTKIDSDIPKHFKGTKDEVELHLEGLRKRLEGLQELLYAQSQHKLLIVLQAMDTGGKDGVIRHVFSGVNPQGVDVFRFKVPSVEEMSHDYLWRVHARSPEKGKITIFNRSHYEDVVVVKVHKLVKLDEIHKRYGHINDFERMLTDEGVTILKFFLHISKKEQRERIQERLDDKTKNWKFTLSDVHERKSWSKYMSSYQEAIEKTSTSWAPWCVVPSDKKWYRNLVITQSIVDHLEGLKMKYPKTSVNPKTVFFK